MARGRMISKSLSASQRYASLQGPLAEFAQAMYPLMVSHADDFGRQPGDVFTVKHVVHPTSPRTTAEFDVAIYMLAVAGLILRYRVGNKVFIQIADFDDHQTGLHKRTSSKFPEPPGITEYFMEYADSLASLKFRGFPSELNLTEPNLTKADQEQPSRTQAGHPSGEDKSTEDQLNANDGREVYNSGRPMLMPLKTATREEFTRMYPTENPAALTKIAHGVLTDRDNGRIPHEDAPETAKGIAARAGLAYGGDRVRKALDSAEHRRQRDTPISAALRIAEDVLRQAPGLTLTVPEFHRVIFDRTAREYGDVPDFADAVRTLLYDPKWPKHDPDHFGFTDTLKDPETGKRLLKPVVGSYHWKLGANT